MFFTGHRGYGYMGVCYDCHRSAYVHLPFPLLSKLTLNGFQIFTGSVPFSHIKRDTSVIMYVIAGGRPLQQYCQQISNEIWRVLERCWDVEPGRRPSMVALSCFFALQMTSVAGGRARL